ncbi:MAG: alpha-N-arabinofuranosidase [Clostridiales bacterium]|nr:alpha-N-arabinofuranosidase [Clostridiales bacterium]
MFRLTVHGDDRIARIEPEIYGHFTEHIGGVFYDGIWVGEDSPVPNIRGLRLGLIEKLKAIGAPVIRWPGGCFAETYDWRDGIGPREDRPTRINWWQSYDGRYEPNSVGTHEFVDFCRLAGAEPYIAANITSLTPLAIRDWIDYCNSPAGSTTLAREREKNGFAEPFNVRYWGVGNETWGGGGNMTGETYAHEFRRYAVIMKNACRDIELICSGANHSDWHWANDVLRVLEPSLKKMDGLSLHFYCGSAGNPLSFTEEEWYRQLRQALDIGRAIDRNWGFVVGYGMEKYARLVIDEWGCWHPAGSGPSVHMKEYGIDPAPNNPDCVGNLFEQQSTMRDGIVAAATLNLFNNNAEKIRMAAVAQLVNNLHSLFLAGGDRLITTPTYHVFDMMKYHMGGDALRVSGDTGEIRREKYSVPNLSVSASVREGVLSVTLANLSVTEAAGVSLELSGLIPERKAEIFMLTAGDPHACNTYDEPEKVCLSRSTVSFDGSLTVPAFSALTARIRLAAPKL